MINEPPATCRLAKPPSTMSRLASMTGRRHGISRRSAPGPLGDWVPARYRVRSPGPRKFVEETFLSPSAVRYYFDTWEPHDLNVLIGLVPDTILAEHVDRLVEMWPTLPYRAAIDAAAFLARHDGVRAASLFEDYLSTPDAVRPQQISWHPSVAGSPLAPEATRRI